MTLSKANAYRCVDTFGKRACPLRLLRRHLSQRERLSPAGRRNVFVSVSFRREVCYTCSAVHPRYLTGEGVKGLNHLLTILESVVADVISHYICKWLGKLDKNRKPD